MSEKDDADTRARLTASLGATLRDLVSTCLGEIIGCQEQASLYLTTERQLADLAGPVMSLNVRDEFADWRFVTLEIHTPEWRERKVYLLGLRASRIITMTSSVLRVDFDAGRMQTRNSVYRLRMDARGQGEPSEGHLIQICATLNGWGVGPALGVPPFII